MFLIQIIKLHYSMDRHFLAILLFAILALSCNPCYNKNANENCLDDQIGKDSYTLHMAVHPHLDAFWIFDFQSYYDPQPHQGDVHGYFMSNRFTSVKDIFRITKDVLWQSKMLRQKVSNKTQKAHRSFFNSEIGFFKRWFSEQTPEEKLKVKQILKTKYWEILGGGYVQHDEGCAYYDDIIENFQLGLHFLKEEFDYYPKVAISADSFGHSQTTLAILAHLGIQGFFVERSDQHILLQNKTEFIWKAQSANGNYYGALPTHIRWAIHGFQDQFIGNNVQQQFCHTKQGYMNNLRNQNKFLKRILKSNHIMRYFGHDFQEFNNYSYTVIESMMKKFSMEKCNKVVAIYGNPTEYFITLMGEVFGKNVKPVATRNQDIFPIWDYDSGLYWTGYFTTDAYHKKDYRDISRYLHGVRKLFVNTYLNDPDTDKNKNYYKQLEQLAQQVSYLQHHDGISGTSKYTVMDKLQLINEGLLKNINKGLVRDIFESEFPIGTSAPIFDCHLGRTCRVPEDRVGDLYLKIINTDGSPVRDPVIIEIPAGKYYKPDCQYDVNCFCYEDTCPCRLYLYKPIYTFTSIRLKYIESSTQNVNKLTKFNPNQEYSFNSTHFTIKVKGSPYSIGYKRVTARATTRNYDHLTRYGTQGPRQFYIRPGKYALGNDPTDIKDFSDIKRVSTLSSQKNTFFLIEWNRYKMKTLITISKSSKNQFKVETITATEGYHLSDLYFEVITPIQNNNQFVTDSNGWLTVTRQLFKHQDYQAFFSKQKFDDLNGNSYPATTFAYIQDQKDKVSVNLDRPQGVTAYRPGTLWVNFDRLSQDDGKWVYQNAYRSQYQKYTHTITVQNKNYNERRIQRQYDQFLFIQGNALSPNERIEDNQVDQAKRNQWNQISNIDDLKFSIRPFNDSTTIFRVHNLHDKQSITVGLFAGKTSPILNTYYARSLTFDEIQETNLGGNMPYSKFINDKWNWNNVINLTQENNIFNKVFRENITLRPLQIRTFSFKGLRFDDKCHEVSEIKYDNLQTAYTLSTTKQQPTREPITLKIEEEVIRYNKEGDHCNSPSPIVDKSNIQAQNTKKSTEQQTFQSKPVSEKAAIKAKNDRPVQKQITQKSTQKVKPPSKQTSKPKKPTQKQKQAPNATPAQKPNKETVPLTLNQIQQKVKNLLPLTKSQKQYYFSNKLAQLRAKKVKVSST